ncbi:hypothetical protein PG984_011223 [Apiospora sp. TS-2023a]
MSSQQPNSSFPPEYAVISSAPRMLSEINNRYNKEQLKSLCQQNGLDASGFKHALLGRYTLYLMKLPMTDPNEKLAMELWRSTVNSLLQIAVRVEIPNCFGGKGEIVCEVLKHQVARQGGGDPAGHPEA